MLTRWGSLLIRIGAIALMLNLAWQAWDNFGPHRPEVSALRAQMVKNVLPSMVADLQRAGKRFRHVELLHLQNDPSGYVTNQLRSALGQSGIFDLQPRTFIARLEGAFGIARPGVGDAATAMRDAQGQNAVIFGTVRRFYSAGDSGRLDLSLNLADIATGHVVFSRRYQETHSPTEILPVGTTAGLSLAARLRRLLGWLITILLLPVFTIGFLRATVRKKSNRANAFAMGVYTAVDAGLAILFMGISFSSWLAMAFLILAVTAAAAYNVAIMTFSLRLEE
ncbi:MAG: hypothetical protein ACP5I8_14930 [Phycisphaerae bacterium]